MTRPDIRIAPGRLAPGRLDRWRLHREVRATMRSGRAARHRATLAAIRAGLVGATVAAVDDGGQVAEVSFRGGTTIRVGPVHGPTLESLRQASRAGGAWLVRAADHGRCWGLYFATTRGPLPLLAGEVRIVPRGGLSLPGRAGPPLALA